MINDIMFSVLKIGHNTMLAHTRAPMVRRADRAMRIRNDRGLKGEV